MQHYRTDMKHFICSIREGVYVCVCWCVCPRGVSCQWGSAERLLGEDPPVKWSSSPRWVSNSLNPTGQHAGLCLAAAPQQKPGSPLLLPPLAPFQLPSAYLTSSLAVSPSCLTLPVFPEEQQEANEAWLAFIQPSIPSCVSVCACVCVRNLNISRLDLL